jgi:chemotaxis protein methyltransferase CheR
MTAQPGRDQCQATTPSAQDIVAIAAIAHAEAGIVIAPDKGPMIQSRLLKHLRRLGMADFAEYLRYVQSERGRDERRQMISALTTNVTHFFREKHHFDQLRDTVLPPLIARARAGGKVRIWSAGCSGGQEAYSIAMTAHALDPLVAELDLRILATDIDPCILSIGQAARYPTDSLGPVDPDLQRRCFDPDGDAMRLKPALRRMVAFNLLNLHAPWPMKGRFDVIFCRNVVIYFDPAAQARLWARFAAALVPGGHLFVGHS